MRWIVEVTPIGSNDTKPYCVEADSWQKALQATRKLRVDTTPMSGFSIELLTDGCKAVDPASRNRYEVRRTSNDAPLSEGGEAAPSTRKSRLPRSGKASKADVSIPPAARVPVFSPSEGGDSSRELQPSPAPAPIKTAAKVNAAPTKSADLSAEPSPAGARVLMKREQEATAQAPLTYREFAFEVSKGATEAEAVAVLVSELARIQKAIASAPAGKLVNLAAFDEAFEGRPKTLPLATVTWKDWREDLSTAFPRRDREANPPSSRGPASSKVEAPPTRPSVAAAPSKTSLPAPAPSASARSITSAPVATIKSVAPASSAPKSVVPSAPRSASAIPAPTPSESKLSRRSKTPPPKATPKRIAGEELIGLLFESMHDMHFMVDAVEGANFCLGLASLHLPARVAIIYFYDINRREFVVASALAQNAGDLLLQRYSEAEPLLTKTMRKQRGLLLSQGDVALIDSPVFQAFGGAKSAILAPVKLAGRFLGIVALADATDGVPFTEMDANGVNYMAEQLAEFLGTRGLVIDPERIKPSVSA